MDGIDTQSAGSPAMLREASEDPRPSPKAGWTADHFPGAERDGRNIALGGVAALLAAALCCGLPYLVIAAGAFGAWIGKLTGLGLYLPILLFIPLALLGVGAWQRQCRVPAGGDGGCVGVRSGRIGLPNS